MSGSDAEFRLGNGTSRTIGLIGARSLVAGADYWVTCDNMTGRASAEQCHQEKPCASSSRANFRKAAAVAFAWDCKMART